MKFLMSCSRTLFGFLRKTTFSSFVIVVSYFGIIKDSEFRDLGILEFAIPKFLIFELVLIFLHLFQIKTALFMNPDAFALELLDGQL